MAMTKECKYPGNPKTIKIENLLMQFITPIDAAKALEKSTPVHDKNS